MKGSTAQGTVSATHWAVWGQHLAIAAAYAACYELARYVSLPQWSLAAGLRLACLLLLPMRYWPALALGEGLPLLEVALLCASQFGMGWAVAQAVPMIVLWMALLKPLRLRWSITDAQGRLRMPLILVAALGTSVITAASTMIRLMLALQHDPGKWPEASSQDFFAYLLGAFLGALTLTPVVLAVYERYRDHQDGTMSLSKVWKSSLLRDSIWWVLPTLAGLAWIALATQENGVCQMARLAMLWPVVGLTWRHGWHGAAVGGMSASIALAVTIHGPIDPVAIRVQVILALAIAGCLWAAANTARRPQSLTVPTSPER